MPDNGDQRIERLHERVEKAETEQAVIKTEQAQLGKGQAELRQDVDSLLGWRDKFKGGFWAVSKIGALVVFIVGVIIAIWRGSPDK